MSSVWPAKTTSVDVQSEPAAWSTAANVEAQGSLDENLHFGRAWHRYRYRYCQKRGENGACALRILDVMAGTGRASIEAAQLNPGARVLGIHGSAAAVELARDAVGTPDSGITFHTHDLGQPLPESLGPFDFIICRGGFGRLANPNQVLKNLARVLEPDGLIYGVLPSREGKTAWRSLKQAIFALASKDADQETLAEVGLRVFQSLRPNHPIRVAACDGNVDPEQFVLDSLTTCREWTLEEAESWLDEAGLKLLYTSLPWQWRPDRVFDPEKLSFTVDTLEPSAQSRLIDALDPSLLGDSYRIYACHASFQPELPTWPWECKNDPEVFENLVPHLTGLAHPTQALTSAAPGRVVYRTVSGVLGELDRWSNLLLSSVDGRTTCGTIEKTLASRSRASDDLWARQRRWIDLADCGLILLEPSEKMSLDVR